METDFSKLTEEQIVELAHNQSHQAILNISHFLEESIRQYFSRLLMDTDAENPLTCHYVIETPEDCGLSDLEKPTLISMYQDPTEGYMYFLFEGTEEYCDFEEFSLSALMLIINAIENNK